MRDCALHHADRSRAGILLGFQYRLLDGAVDRLMAEIIELSEVHVAASCAG